MTVKTILGTTLALAALSLATTNIFAAHVKCYGVKKVIAGKDYAYVKNSKKCVKMGGSVKPVKESTTTQQTTTTTN